MNRNITIIDKNNKKSQVIMSWNFKFLKEWISFILSPTYTDKKINGVKPIKLIKIYLNSEIFNIDSIKFWINKGNPGSNLKIIKYSYDEFWIYLSKYWEYLE